jgi:cyclopropane fatty-acyl-phospholipid synthase-like methyltransferase
MSATDPVPALANANPYDSVDSAAARRVLEQHYDVGANLYKFWASPKSVWRAILLGWARSRHPAHLHYAWDLEGAPSLDEGILETTRRAIALLDLDGVERPHLFEPGCGIGGGVTQVAHMLPRATVTGLSLVQRQLDIGRRRAHGEGVEARSAFCCGNYLHTPFADASFDGIFALETLVYTPAAERGRLFREMFRILRSGRTFVSFDGFRLRDPVTAQERDFNQDVMDGWTLPLPPLPAEFRDHAQAAGFEVLRQEEATSHVYVSAQRIATIATSVLLPLSVIARVPLLGGLLAPLGFASPRHARRFVDACRSQVKVFDHGLGAYYIHVFRKPRQFG